MQCCIDVATIPIFFGSGLAFLLSVEQLTRKKPNKANLLFSSILLCCCIIIWGTGVVANRLLTIYPWMIYLFFTAICSVGPLYYIYFRVLLHSEEYIGNRSLFHFVPTFCVLLIETGFQFLSLDFKRQVYTDLLESPLQHIMMWLIIIGAFHAFAYLVYLVKIDLSMVWNVEKIKTELRSFIAVNLLAILAVVTLFIGFTFKMHLLFVFGGNFLALLVIGIFLGYNRYPDFLQMLITEIEKKRYEKSTLNNVDISSVNTHITHLFNEELVYKDPDINLKRLAEMLLISPHQLSQFLNEHLQLDFRSFINSYRIKEAKKILVEQPDKTVLEICYDVGFGSKSTFNSVFKKNTGQTPTEFRESNLS